MTPSSSSACAQTMRDATQLLGAVTFQQQQRVDTLRMLQFYMTQANNVALDWNTSDRQLAATLDQRGRQVSELLTHSESVLLPSDVTLVEAWLAAVATLGATIDTTETTTTQ